VRFWFINIVWSVALLIPVLGSSQTTLSDTLLADHLVEKAKGKVDLQQYDSAEFYADRALREARKVFYRIGKAESQLVLAEVELERDDLPGAIRNYFGALKEYEMLGDTLEMAGLNSQIGLIFYEADLPGKALEYFLKTELLLKNRKTDNQKSDIIENIADAFAEIDDYPSALNYYERLVDIYKVSGKNKASRRILTKMIICYNNLAQYDRSLQYNIELLELYRQAGDKQNELVSLNNIGYIYKYLEDYDQSLKYFNDALELENSLTGGEPANPVTLINMAVVSQNIGEYDTSLDLLLQAREIKEKEGDTAGLARLNNLMANVYYHLEDYHNARIYNQRALNMAKESGDNDILRSCYLTASLIDEKLYDYENSLANFKEYLRLTNVADSAEREKRRELIQQQFIVEKSVKEIELLLLDDELRDREMQQLRLEAENRARQLEVLQTNNELQKVTIANQELEKNRALQDKLLAEEQLKNVEMERERDSLVYREQIQTLELREAERQSEIDHQEIELLTKDREYQDLQLSKARSRNMFLAGIFVLAILVLFAVYRGLRFARKANKKLTLQKEEIKSNLIVIDKERKKSDKLLLNILPEETATELKEKGSATPKHYDKVSVLFTDFVGFTHIAERLTPDELIHELNQCFLEFDKIIDKHNLEKIKTIGDAYMCAGGIPVSNETNPEDIVQAGLEIQQLMQKMKAEKEKSGEPYWEVRLGIHTGQVVAGVVGKNKFAYDIWGDAVNIASRMESSGKSGKVNISGSTYDLVKDHFKCSYRGKVLAKNKGEIDMYFVEGEL